MMCVTYQAESSNVLAEVSEHKVVVTYKSYSKSTEVALYIKCTSIVYRLFMVILYAQNTGRLEQI